MYYCTKLIKDIVNIILVNWNLKDDTQACIDSLLSAGVLPEQIILVDNGSMDGSVPAFRSRYGETLQIIANPENIGFAPACNQGLRQAMGRDAQWMLILNNDTLVAPDFFDQLGRIPSIDPGYAILSPAIYYHGEPERIWYLADRLIPRTLITINPYRGKPLPENLPEFIPTDFASGCAMLIQREVFEKIGFFDPSLIMYGEEVDFCWRARMVGYQIAALPKARIWHKVSASASQVKPQARYLKTRNQIRFYKKYARGIQVPLMFAFSLFRLLRVMLYDLSHFQMGLILPLIRGWSDGWRR